MLRSYSEALSRWSRRYAFRCTHSHVHKSSTIPDPNPGSGLCSLPQHYGGIALSFALSRNQHDSNKLVGMRYLTMAEIQTLKVARIYRSCAHLRKLCKPRWNVQLLRGANQGLFSSCRPHPESTPMTFGCHALHMVSPCRWRLY
jgi:hypothetical protein